MGSLHGYPSEARVASPSLAEQVLDALGSAVAVLDAEGRVRAVNAAWARAAGAPADTLAGLRVGDDLIA
ncbi:MAG: hypothetical protein JWN46_3511, partial [Acidimicrobiales bacterium]|nr:hypothetical protein [Acidimicrobiales bacterium]